MSDHEHGYEDHLEEFLITTWAERPADMPEARGGLAKWLDEKGSAAMRLILSDQPGMEHWGPSFAREMRGSTMFWVTKEMAALTATAMQTLPPTPDAHLLCPFGLAMFASPIEVGDAPCGCPIEMRGAWWGERPDGAFLILFTAIPGRTDGLSMGGPFVVTGSAMEDWRKHNDQGVFSSVQTFWLLAAQRLATVRCERPDRAARRRCERLRLPAADGVEIVDLRRLESHEPSGETRDVEWSHQWLVDGHWRNQYLPSTDEHRPTWISPYVKGPADKPLVVRERVYQWRR